MVCNVKGGYRYYQKEKGGGGSVNFQGFLYEDVAYMKAGVSVCQLHPPPPYIRHGKNRESKRIAIMGNIVYWP